MKSKQLVAIFLFFFTNTLFLFSKEIIFSPLDLEVKIGLALSGGGSRGIAQIGVLKILEKENIPIYAITGTSIGAFIGGLYAVGYSPKELEEIALTTKWDNVLTILQEQDRSELFFDQKVIQDRTFATLRFKNFKFVYPQALSLGWKFNSFIQKLIWNGAYISNDFDKLKIPFRAVATDVVKGKTISIGKGNLTTAMRASAAIPLLNTPIQSDTAILVDGGLFANLPVEQTLELKPDIVIGINTTTPILKREDLNKPWTLASQIISIYMDRYFTEALTKADLVLTPDIGDHPNDNFNGLDTLVRKGEECALNSLPKLREIINLYKDSLINIYIQKIRKEYDLEGILAVKQLKLDLDKENNELYKLTTEPDGVPLQTFFLNLDRNEVEKVRIFSEKEGLIIIELSKYPKIDGIKCICEPPLNNKKADSLLSLFIGHCDNPFTRKQITETAKKAFAKDGYSFVKIEIAPSSFSKNLTLKISPNRISRITIDNRIKTSEYIVRRELTFREGDFTNSEEIAQSWNNLISTGLFSDVFIDFQIDTTNSSCEIFVSANERGTQVLNLLLRVDSENNLQGGIDLIHENLFNTGTRFLVSFWGCKTDLLAKINFSQPRVWKTNFTLSAEGFYHYRIVPIFERKKPSPLNKYESFLLKNIETEKYSFNFSAGTQIERLGNLSVGLKFEKQRYYDENEEQKPPFYNISNLIIGLIFDSRDKAEFSTDGRFINIFLETPLFKLPQNSSFTRAVFLHSNHFSFNDFVIRPTILFGFADNTLPFPDFFALGGEENFYGFLKDEMLGRQIFNAKLDFQYHLPFKIYFDTYLTLTYNLGSVWEHFEVIRISELKHGIGFSIGFDTPIGPVRFSAGNIFYFLKNPNTTVWGPLQLYFSVGSKLF
ncbi:MAG: patatin-like phospholipase family protein [Ignavibacteria bacterium]|nr:patatin-like phospholipase family protein [Ignavibacteria bacterium]